MKRSEHAKRQVRRAGSAAVALAAIVLAQVQLVPAVASAAPATPAAEESVTSVDEQSSEALAEARETGEPVEILGQRSETSQVFANPSGTFTEERYALPQWVRKGEKLVAIDPTLQATAAGYQTKATEVDVTFSAGGTSPMATVRRDGRSLAFSWPHALPAPQVTGETATYPEVLSGADLKLHATPSGFSQVLVVKSAEAAANPELQQLEYKVSSDGVRLEEDSADNLRALNPAGEEIFTGPAPRMWDSTTDDSTPVTTAKQASVAAAGDTATASPGDAFVPPPGSQQAPVPLDTDGKTLTLTPDQGLLTDNATQYPVYIDPSISGSRYSWTIVNKKYPSSSFYNGAGWINSDGSKGTTTARAGYENETDGVSRSYFRLNTKNLWNTNKVITKSTFRIKNTWSWSCTARRVDLYRTGVFDSSTTWSKQPAKGPLLSSVNDAKGWGSGCPAGNLAFDTTAAAKDAAANHWNTLALLLQAASETDVYGWKKFDATSAVLSTEYNTVPNVPTGLYTSPGTGANCGVSTPYTVIGNTDITLGGKFSDPDGGSLKARFVLWPTGHGGAANEVNTTVSATSGTVGKLAVSKATLASLLKGAGVTGTGTFTWWARAEDGTSSSTYTAQCHFQFDGTRPSQPPTVSSAQFPDGSDGWPQDTGSVRTQGTFTLGNGGITDVSKYEYWTDWDPTVRTATPPALGGSTDIKITPVSAGSHILYARSIDRGNNASDRAAYLFYANGPKQADQPADINGDGNPDMYGIAQDGTLNRFYGAGDGTVTKASSPTSDISWTGAKITHRGDWTGDGYEDLISLKHDNTTNTDQLWMHPNTGYGSPCTDCSDGNYDQRELSVYDPANNHWQGADEILAVGDVDGPLDVDNDGTDDVPGYPDLLVRQGDLLWLYFGALDYRLDSDREPILIGADGWANHTLAAPGNIWGDERVDLLARNNETGVLYLYTGTGDDGDGMADQATKLQTGTGFTPADVPLITSPGDADHDGYPDMWVTRDDGHLWFLPRVTKGDKPIIDLSDGWSSYQAIS
ncbi:VCBS repeat-containing protein [Streptomyces sp. SCL15-6]|uniref:FG-GAP repeat domain-containing protein n=1 Tax=Streptomyces sp. SCL15-6 TaxID=2967222 RepID=UPI0029674A37|nr:VCBS repeat-containing protein [Streptomyces sp. SCL15-6]